MTVDTEVSTAAGLGSVIGAVTGQALRLAEWAGDLDEGQLLRPSRMDGWRVHEVLVHLNGSMTRLGRAVREPEARVRQVTFEEYCTSTWRDAEQTRLRVIEDAAAVPIAGSGRLLAQTARSLVRRIDLVEGDKLVVMRRGTMVLSDVLAVHCLELLGHAVDLARDVGTPRGDLCDPRAVGCASTLLHGPALELLDGASTGWVRRLCPAVA
jgi:hypothetical protein